MKFADEEIALYDLGNRPASYDVMSFLAVATAHGAKHVRLVLTNGWKPKNYNKKQAVERFISIVEPAAAFYGLDYSVGERRGIEYGHMLGSAIEAYQKLGRIGKIKLPCRASNYITITMRKSRTPERDSNEAEWLKFASRLQCQSVIIPDWDERPISLEQRWDLYANAKMNFMVINGPLTLCLHSDAPYLSMKTIGGETSAITSPQQMALMGITPGFQFPWAIEGQRLSYLTDTCDNIEAEWAAMQQEERKVA